MKVEEKKCMAISSILIINIKIILNEKVFLKIKFLSEKFL
jgi:hypothetical protein